MLRQIHRSVTVTELCTNGEFFIANLCGLAIHVSGSYVEKNAKIIAEVISLR